MVFDTGRSIFGPFLGLLRGVHDSLPTLSLTFWSSRSYSEPLSSISLKRRPSSRLPRCQQGQMAFVVVPIFVCGVLIPYVISIEKPTATGRAGGA